MEKRRTGWQVLLIAALCSAMAGLGTLSAQAAGPRISVEENTYDFGTALEGDVVIHDFLIRNLGDEMLDIKNVKTG